MTNSLDFDEPFAEGEVSLQEDMSQGCGLLCSYGPIQMTVILNGNCLEFVLYLRLTYHADL